MNRDLHYLQLRKTVSQEGKHCRSTVLEKGMFRGWIYESREGFFWRGRGKSFDVEELKTEKAQGPMPRNGEKSGTRNLETESVRSRVESVKS